MKILKLKLRNFKGLKNFVLDTAGGGDVTVYGDNATGKTTLADAFMWLLFDKDSLNRKEFEIKTLDGNGQPIHGLEHEVEATLELANGRQITLRKVFKEKWTKRRGSAEKQFTGHTVDHFVDGVPVKKSEFQAAVAEIADEHIFRLLTDPTYFNEHLHWQKRREILLEVCGDITDEEVISSDPELVSLREILAGRSLEQHRKVVLARRAEINKELERIPVRIDEVTQGLPEVPEGASKDAIRAEIERLRGERAAKEAERARIEAGGEAAELQKRLREIEAEMLDVQRRMRARVDESVQAERQRLAEVSAAADAKRIAIRTLQAEVQEAQRQAQRIKDRMDELRKKWFEVNGREFTFEQDTTCPACGQPLPEERLQEARQKALAEFNARKARDLEEISAEGKLLKAQLEKIEAANAERQAVIQRVEQELAALEAQVAEIRARIDQLQTQVPPLSQDPDYLRLEAERQQVAAGLDALRAGNAEALQRVAGEIRALDEQIRVLERTLHQIETRERGMARIEELKTEERRLAAEYEDLEYQLHLMERFTRAKVRLLEDRINSRFRQARFKLFNVLVNGGIEECCETTYNGVPYGNLNHGARLNVGLDIINTLAEHYGFAPPVWIDNAESVTSILPTRGQQIRLVVSAADKSLRVETAERVKEAV